MSRLSSLPEELLCQISGFVHPQTIIDWACTCKVHSRCSLKALKLHRQRQADFRVVHDRNPITIPSLLQTNLSEPEILWYVRSLDVWESREKFVNWKSPVLLVRNPFYRGEITEKYLNWPENHHEYSHLDNTFYNDEELERFHSILSGLLRLKHSLVDKWMDRLQSGSDEPLKVLLMAISPRLSKVTFINYGHPRLEGHPLRMLSSTLRALAPLRPLEWPCFQNLKTVYVGHRTELRDTHRTFTHSGIVAPFFLLPAIEDLYFHLSSRDEFVREFDRENDEEYSQDGEPYIYGKPYIWEWEKGRSSCQKLACEWAE